MRDTQLFKDIFKQSRFKDWDEAFRALTPVMRQQSVRVADYTRVLFQGVCKSSFYLNDNESPVYVDGSYEEVAYKCGFYHQIGKALDPNNYPEWREDFSLDEKNNYCRYAVDGREIVAELQGTRGKEKVSVPNKMIQDACEFHMERWDGTGFPYGYEGNEISLIAQIVGLAKELDHLVCDRKSESPFEEAVDILLEQEGIKFSQNLMDVFRNCQTELRKIYKKYIQYTQILPKTVPLVERRPERPFGLNYSQVVAGDEMSTFIFEAVPWFGGVLDQPETTQSAEEVEPLLMRTDMIKDISMYLLYEAADAVARIKNCRLYTGGILIPMFADYFKGEGQLENLEKLYEDTSIDRRKLMLMVPEKLLTEDRSIYTRLTEYIENGVMLVLGGYHPENMPISQLREIGFTHVRLAPDSSVYESGQNIRQELQDHGITVIDWPVGAGQLTEDELIQYLLDFE